MNAFFFGAKRAFLGSLRVLRKPLHGVAPGLTPARFDMMFALASRTFDARGLEALEDETQSDVRRALGLSASVVSRMLRALEELGWVKRTRPTEKYEDRRQRYVTLTEAGLACVREAFRGLFRAAERIVTRAVCFGGRGDHGTWFEPMATLEEYLDSLRAYCRDTATLDYRWGHPDD